MTPEENRRYRADRNRAPRRDPWHRVRPLVVTCLLGLSTAAGITLYMADGQGSQAKPARLAITAQQTDRFRIGGIAFGMTPPAVQRLRPDFRPVAVRGSATVGRFSDGGANHTVWFTEAADGKRAYRIRYDRTFRAAAEEMILGELGRKLGLPAASRCKRRHADGKKECRFDWWPADGVSIRAVSRVSTDAAGRDRIALTVIAEDSYLMGRRMRTRQARNRAPAALKVNFVG